MDHVRSMEEQILMQRMRKKLEEVNAAVQKHLEGVQDHVNFTMQVRPSQKSRFGFPLGRRFRVKERNPDACSWNLGLGAVRGFVMWDFRDWHFTFPTVNFRTEAAIHGIYLVS
jgi:hypothetical protein